MLWEKQEFSNFFREINHSFRYFVSSYTTAVKKGAAIAEQEMFEAIKDRDQPSNIVAGKFFKAILKGVKYAGEQMIISVGTIFEQMKTNLRKK